MARRAGGGGNRNDINGRLIWRATTYKPDASVAAGVSSKCPKMVSPTSIGEASIFNEIADALRCPQRSTFLDDKVCQLSH